MKTKQTQRSIGTFAFVAALLFLLVGGLTARAQQVLTNTFPDPGGANVSAGAFDYVANGIVGDTNWDGVYMDAGDINFGTYPSAQRWGGDGPPFTTLANTYTDPGLPTSTGPGSALVINQGNNSDGGSAEDGFFIWKLVTGNFDVAVRSIPPYNIAGNMFTGLMVRPWNTNNTGAPVDFVHAVQDVNNIKLFRASQYGIDEVRQASNSGTGTTTEVSDNEYTFTDNGDAPGTTSSGERMLRMTRVGNAFQFYWATNLSDIQAGGANNDNWQLITSVGNQGAANSIVRGDWAGQPVQVGIAYTIFSGGAGAANYYDSFQITGPNLNLSAGPEVFTSQASGLQVLSTDPVANRGTIVLSWTPGTLNDSSTVGSVVMMRPATNIIVQPISGLPVPIAATGIFINGTNGLYGGSNNFVVYAGTGSTVTLTNAGGPENLYQFAVYAYSNNAVANTATYDTASPGTLNQVAGPGAPVSINVAFTPLPTGGAGLVRVFVNFSTGETIDFSSSPDITVMSDNTANISVGNANVLNALGAAGSSANITVTYSTLPSVSQLVTIGATSYTDGFTVTHDYLASGLTGTGWDGIYTQFGDLGSADNEGAATAPSTILTFNANVAPPNGSNNALYIGDANADWNGAGNDGPFLFKYVAGDFEAIVHVTNHGVLYGDSSGLMARLFNTSTFGGGGAGGQETHVNFYLDHDFANPEAAITVDGNTTGLGGVAAADTWLMIMRFNSTNFYFLESSSPTANGWTVVPGGATVVPEAAGLAMQVGIVHSQEGNTLAGYGALDNFAITGPGINSTLSTPPVVPPPAVSDLALTLNPNLSITLTWDAVSNGVPLQTAAVMRDGSTVTAQLYNGALFSDGRNPSTSATETFKTGSYLGNGTYVVYRSAVNPPTTAHNVVTVTGLNSGDVYFAQVFNFLGTGATKVVSELAITGSSAVISDGNIVAIQTVVNSIPLGGISPIGVTATFSSGLQVSITALVPTTGYATDNSAVVALSKGICTGVALTSPSSVAHITTTYTQPGTSTPLTSTISAVVRNATFNDNFTVAHDYLAAGVAGTGWDGVYTNIGDIPEESTDQTNIQNTVLGSTGGYSTATIPLPLGGYTLSATANMVSNNCLKLTNAGTGNTGWENGNDDGFFLWKIVPGDFQVAVVLNGYSITAYTEGGIMARAYSDLTNTTGFTRNGVYFPPSPALLTGTINSQPITETLYWQGPPLQATSGTNYAPLNGRSGETWVSLNRFDEFGIGTYARQNINNAVTQSTQPDPLDGNTNLLIVRHNYTNFSFYKRSTSTSAWISVPNNTVYNITQVLNKPMQVGIATSTFGSGINGTTGAPRDQFTYSSFMLDELPPALSGSSANGNLTLSWPEGGTFAHLYSSGSLIASDPGNWTLVNGLTYTKNNGIFNVTIPVPAGNGVTTSATYYVVGP